METHADGELRNSHKKGKCGETHVPVCTATATVPLLGRERSAAQRARRRDFTSDFAVHTFAE